MDLAMHGADWTDLHDHFNNWAERVAFLFVQQTTSTERWEVRETWLLGDDGDYGERDADHLVLDEEVRPRVIAHAHDGGCAVVEAHSHYWSGRTCFSSYDLRNLREFVPHMQWRLAARPYFALVIGTESFDALAWSPSGTVETPTVYIENASFEPTGLSLPVYKAMLSHG
jgi:hypothetical protein